MSCDRTPSTRSASKCHVVHGTARGAWVSSSLPQRPVRARCTYCTVYILFLHYFHGKWNMMMMYALVNCWSRACSTAHWSNRPCHWDGLLLDRSAVGQLSSLYSRKWQRLPAGNTLRSVSPAGNCCHFVLLDKDESCPTADLSNIGRPNGPACSTGELLNTPLIFDSFYCTLIAHVSLCVYLFCSICS